MLPKSNIKLFIISDPAIQNKNQAADDKGQSETAIPDDGTRKRDGVPGH